MMIKWARFPEYSYYVNYVNGSRLMNMIWTWFMNNGTNYLELIVIWLKSIEYWHELSWNELEWFEMIWNELKQIEKILNEFICVCLHFSWICLHFSWFYKRCYEMMKNEGNDEKWRKPKVSTMTTLLFAIVVKKFKKI